MRNPPDMPKLQENMPTHGVNAVRHRAPRLDLRVGPNPRRIGITHALRRHRRGFGQDQPRQARWT